MKYAIRSFILLLFLSSSLYSENAIPTFSEDEKEQVNHVLHYLFKFDHFSYTLFSDKPISIFPEIHFCLEDISDLKDLERYCLMLAHRCSFDKLESCWNLWELKFSEIQFKHFLFFEKTSPENSIIMLINKQAFCNIFAAHKKLFEKILGEGITEQSLLNKIQSSEFSLRRALNNSEELLGLLLGYGHCNSKLFEQRSKLSGNHVLNTKFRNNEISKIERNLVGTGPTSFAYFNICTISPMGFVADIKHPETKKLLKKYDRARHEIAPILQNWLIVDEIISQLTKESNNQHDTNLCL
jgi:hypothetical protein